MAISILIGDSEAIKKDAWPESLWKGDHIKEDPDCNQQQRWCFDYIISDWASLWNIIRITLATTVYDDLHPLKPKQWLWPEALYWVLDDLKEFFVAAYLLYIRKRKIGVDCGNHGRWAHDFDTGEALYEIYAKRGGNY